MVEVQGVQILNLIMKNSNKNKVINLEKRLLTAQEVAQIINASDKSIYKMALRGEIPCIRIAAKIVRFDQGDIEKWLESKKQNDQGYKFKAYKSTKIVSQ